MRVTVGIGWINWRTPGSVIEIIIPTAHDPEPRWVPAELAGEYRDTFADNGRPTTDDPASPSSLVTRHSSLIILRRFLRHAGPVTRAEILARYVFPPEWLDETLVQLVAEREVVQGYFGAPAKTPSEVHHGAARMAGGAETLQFCDRHLFEQLHRATLAILRREVQPVPLAAFADFLLGWQGLRQDGGDRGGSPLQAIMEQLRGAALPGIAWERDILPARVPGFQPAALAALCESGEWVWSASGQDPRRADVRFFRRGEGALFLDPAAERLPLAVRLPADGAPDEGARRVLAFLKEEGASFLTDLQGGLGMKAAELQAALVALALAGLVTSDSLDALRAVLSHRGDAETQRPTTSALEEELAARLSPRPITGMAGRARYHSAKQRVSQRLRSQEQPDESGFWRGRWALVHRLGILGPARSETDLALERAPRAAGALRHRDTRDADA